MNHIPSSYCGFVAAPLRYEMKEAHGKSGLDQIVSPGFAKKLDCAPRSRKGFRHKL
jgi:hypothetical protein